MRTEKERQQNVIAVNSKIISRFLPFWISGYWLENLAPISQPFTGKSKSQLRLDPASYPAGLSDSRFI